MTIDEGSAQQKSPLRLAQCRRVQTVMGRWVLQTLKLAVTRGSGNHSMHENCAARARLQLVVRLTFHLALVRIFSAISSAAFINLKISFFSFL